MDQGTCDICGAGPMRPVEGLFDLRAGIPGRWRVLLCPGCGAGRLDPPDAAGAEDSYLPFAAARGTAYRAAREAFVRSPLYRLWLALDADFAFHARRGEGRLLDMGCGEGRSLDLFRANGFAVEGVEPSAPAAAMAEARGHRVHRLPAEAFRADRPFDVVVLANVLEHAEDPRAVLAAARTALRPGGALWLSCPNARSFLARLFGRRWINWHPPFHRRHLTPRALRILLGEAGFRPAEIRTRTPALWAAQSAAALLSHPGRPNRALRSLAVMGPLTLTVRMVFWPILMAADRTGRGDCILATARRPQADPCAS